MSVVVTIDRQAATNEDPLSYVRELSLLDVLDRLAAHGTRPSSPHQPRRVHIAGNRMKARDEPAKNESDQSISVCVFFIYLYIITTPS